MRSRSACMPAFALGVGIGAQLVEHGEHGLGRGAQGDELPAYLEALEGADVRQCHQRPRAGDLAAVLVQFGVRAVGLQAKGWRVLIARSRFRFPVSSARYPAMHGRQPVDRARWPARFRPKKLA